MFTQPQREKSEKFHSEIREVLSIVFIHGNIHGKFCTGGFETVVKCKIEDDFNDGTKPQLDKPNSRVLFLTGHTWASNVL